MVLYNQKMSSSGSISPVVVKALASAAVAVAIDKFYFNEANMQKSLMFGASMAVATYLSGMIEDNDILPSMIPDLGTYANGQQVQDRILEIAVGSGTAYAVNRYAFKNATARNDMMKILMAATVADLVAETFTDWMRGDALNPFLA